MKTIITFQKYIYKLFNVNIYISLLGGTYDLRNAWFRGVVGRLVVLEQPLNTGTVMNPIR